jgi:hypothetical protein
MAKRWFQLRGDPSGREFFFRQTRKVSLFDEHLI